jgi:hypothetical protein
MSGFLQPVTAQDVPAATPQEIEISAQQRCELALTDAEKILTDNRYLWITNARVARADVFYVNYPYQVPGVLLFTIAGHDAQAMLKSPYLLGAIAQRLVNGCPGVGLVSFGIADSNQHRDFGLIGGRVREFTCTVPNGPRDLLQWGYTSCL